MQMCKHVSQGQTRDLSLVGLLKLLVPRFLEFFGHELVDAVHSRSIPGWVDVVDLGPCVTHSCLDADVIGAVADQLRV